MIRPSSINQEAHTADFKCDEHGGSVSGLNLNTNTNYNESSSCIIMKGSELTDPCNCISCYPTSNGSALIQELVSAKTT